MSSKLNLSLDKMRKQSGYQHTIKTGLNMRRSFFKKVILLVKIKIFNLRNFISRIYYKTPGLSFQKKRSLVLAIRRYLGFLHRDPSSHQLSPLALSPDNSPGLKDGQQESAHPPANPFILSLPPLRVLFVGHDAAQAGAQMVLLHLMRWLKRHAWVDMRLLLLDGGNLLPAYQNLAPTLLAGDLPANSRLEALRYFCGGNMDLIYGNSAVAAGAYGWLSKMGVPIITHVHELEQSLQRFAKRETLQLMLRHTDHYIAASQPVLDNLVARHGVGRKRGSVVHAFIEPLGPIPLPPQQRLTLREALGLPLKGILVFGCGTRDWRKGADLFVEVARQVVAQCTDEVHFCWVGDGADGRIPAMEWLIAQHGLQHCVTLLPTQQNPRQFFRVGDIFLLPSREDPFPLVCLEAAESALPIICFEGAGGMPAFVADEIGFATPFEGASEMADKVLLLIRDPLLRTRLGTAARKKLLATHVSDREAPRILALCRELAHKPHPLSVIVPNYNCAPYLGQRFDSIFGQTFRDFETIILDDASTDNSLAIISHHADRAGVRTAFNHQNSGNPFQQWRTGLEMARGEWIWIAESDDFCVPSFLDKMLACFTDEKVVLAYCQSVPVGPDSTPLGPDYLDWTDDLDPERWRYPYRATGQEELDRVLAQKNAIINASAVVMRRPPALTAVEDAIPFRFAGDWVTYAGIARHGDVAFIPEALNRHRRHPTANTSKMIGTLDWLAEDLAVKAWFVRKGLVRSNPVLQSICRTIATYEGNVRQRVPGKPDLLTEPSLRTERELARLTLETACGGPARGETILLVADNPASGWAEAVRHANELAAEGKRVFVLAAIPARVGNICPEPLPRDVLLLEGTIGPIRWYDRIAREHAATDEADPRQCRLQTVRQMCRILEVGTILPCGPEATRFVLALSSHGSTLNEPDSLPR